MSNNTYEEPLGNDDNTGKWEKSNYNQQEVGQSLQINSLVEIVQNVWYMSKECATNLCEGITQIDTKYIEDMEGHDKVVGWDNAKSHEIY